MLIRIFIFALWYARTNVIQYTTKANHSWNHFNSHAGIPSSSVALSGAKCLSAALTCPIDNVCGGTSRYDTSLIHGIHHGSILAARA